MALTTDPRLAVLFGRRSIRVYAAGEIKDELVTQLLEAAMAAPSALTKDPWRFVVIRNKPTLSQLSAALPGGKMLETAALAIAVCGELPAAFEQQLSFLLQDCSAATENLLLAAHALGLGACWVGVHPIAEAVLRVRQTLALPASVVPIAIVALGYPGEELEARTRYNGDFVHREKWGA